LTNTASYSLIYPELAVQNPEFQQIFQHILQFDENFYLSNNLPLDQEIENQLMRQRRRPLGSKTKTESWKIQLLLGGNQKKVVQVEDPEAFARRTQ
jgi:hypothetical protein